MMKKIFGFAIMLFLVAVASSCMKDEESEDEKRAKQEDAQIRNYLTSNGITNAEAWNYGIYKVPVVTTTNASPQSTDVSLVDYEMKTLDGTLIGRNENGSVKVKNSDQSSIPYSLPLVLSSMRKGDEAIFLLPSEMIIPSIYGNLYDYNYKDQIKKGNVIILNLKLVDIKTNAEQLQQEIDTITAYVDRNSLSAQRRSSGLHYITVVEGTGAVPAAGTTCSVHYTLKLLDGTQVETSIGSSSGPLQFVLRSDNNLFTGWNEGISLMKKGGKAILIMPSYLTSYLTVIPEEVRQDMISKKLVGKLPQFEPVIFEVELVDIK